MINRRAFVAMGMMLGSALVLARVFAEQPATMPVEKPPSSWGYDQKQFAAGDWSDEVDGLRGRLIIAQGQAFADGKLRETVAYLELRNAPEAAGNSKTVYFDPGLTCEMRDPQGDIVPQRGRGGSGGAGGRPGAELVTLPFDSTLRLRLSPYGYGSADGMRIDISRYEWNIKSSDTGQYTLTATFTSEPLAEPIGPNVWHGTLKLPAVKITMKGF